ncbi:MAG: hypothetical protein ACK424_03100, partial [Candidatus Thermochlorobacter sp.]
LDRGNVPEWKDRPKRLLIILGGFFAGLFLSLSFVIFQYEAAKLSSEPWFQLLRKMFSLR